ncbi:response regulator transcription factor [Paenibacillus thalictri]|uniref:Response regulator n=1 Tax=Paenibacillus thalictri TaxID=2527873 RepID=A0A4Q9DXJ3_9BACL|nr:response regulator [Paenibacillus thalictri]TBL81126.1 response regulator [Paenibacillus thalictri]
MKVLLVEDETLVRRFIKTLIHWEANGFTVVGEASNGEEAWELLQHHAVDIVLTDIRMPALNGFELIERIRGCRLPCEVIVLSSYDDFDYVRNALKLHVSDYVHKATVSGEELLDSLNRAKRDWLNRHEQMLYDRSLAQQMISRKATVAAGLLTQLLEQGADRDYLELLGEQLSIWKEPFQAALLSGDESVIAAEQAEGDIVMFPYEEYWIIAGKHGVKEFAEKRSPGCPAVYSEEAIRLAQWPDLYRKLKWELAEHLRKQDHLSALHVSIREAVEFIEAHYMDEITLELISDRVHISSAYFSRLFQKETGYTFTDYVTSIRINRAKAYLLQTKLPVYDIAERVGYRNSKYFLKLFKETVGYTPTEFRELTTK